jgi:deazaflavin-dependent oxidoreductase (nitroreductase family)
MSLQGEYVPTPKDWVREQVTAYEASDGREANTLRETGIPIIVVTMIGNKTGFVRKIALMRVEHEGSYALVASVGGAPKHPVWYYNLLADPDNVMIQDGPSSARSTATSATHGGSDQSPCTRPTPSTRPRPTVVSRYSSPVRSEDPLTPGRRGR